MAERSQGQGWLGPLTASVVSGSSRDVLLGGQEFQRAGGESGGGPWDLAGTEPGGGGGRAPHSPQRLTLRPAELRPLRR